jgi:hypothetical protein
LLLLFPALAARAQATYNFVGAPFTTFPGSSCRLPTCQLSGSFTVPQPLAPNLSQNILGTTGLAPSSFSFTDGLTTISEGNAASSGFAVETDANGNITQFSFNMASTGVSFSALSTGVGGSTSESDIYTDNPGYGGSLQAAGTSGGSWCVSFPPGSTEANSNPCYLSRSILDFSDLAPGSSSPQQTVTIGNPGSTPLVIANIAIGPDYQQTNDCSTVAPGATCTIGVTFSPAASHISGELLTITDNAASSPQAVYLYGNSYDVAGGSVTIASSLNPSALGQSVTFTATVSNVSPLNGKFEFFDGETSLGLSAVSPDGTGTFATSTLAVGTHSISADYEAPDLSSVGELPLQQVVTAGPAAFTLSVAPATATVTDGNAAAFTLTVTPQNGFDAAVTFSCGVLPAEATCTFSPQSVTPGSAPVTVALSLATTPPTVSSSRIPARPTGLGPGCKALSGLLLAALLWTAPLRPRWLPRSRRRWMALIATGALSTMLLSGCGEIEKLINQNTDPGTPKGTSSVQVTATSGSGASAITQTTTVQVTIQ